MNNLSTATLKDLQSSTEKKFREIDKNLKSYDKGDKKQKTTIKITLSKNLEYIKKFLNEMKMTIEYELNDEKIKNCWEETCNKIKSQIKEYKEIINNLDKEQENNDDTSQFEALKVLLESLS